MSKDRYTGKYLKKWLMTVDIKPVFVKERVDSECLISDIVDLENTIRKDEQVVELLDDYQEALNEQMRRST